MKIKAANTILYCKKWEETIAFYKTGLNLLVIFSNDWFVEFKLNERARISIANQARASIESGNGKGITISLQVDEIQQLRASLTEAGVEISPVKEVWGSKVFYAHDPEGNRLEFWEGRARA